MLIQRAKQLQQSILQDPYNAFIHVCDDIEQQATQVQQRIDNKSAGVLAGKFIAIKSCINTQGLPTTCASQVLKDYIATYDADVITYIKQQDAIIVGMTNMDEFACGISGETSYFKKSINPKQPKRVPGGSSSGSAVAVSAQYCDMALATDTGGSIRNPASHCGIVGIKPSYGRVSRYGLIDLSMSLDQIGPMAQNVQDAALLLSVMSQHTKNDATYAQQPFNMPQLNITKGLKIGIIPEFEALCDPRIWQLLMQTVHTMTQQHQWQVSHHSIAHINVAVQAYYPIVYVELFSGSQKFDGRKYGKPMLEYCGQEVARRILGGKEISKAEYAGRYYQKALQAKEAIKKSFAQVFHSVDIILTPVTPTLPHKWDEELTTKESYAYDVFTTPANLAEICGGVVPMGSIDNTPVGIQVLAGNMQEERLVQAMFTLQETLKK
ncbi:MAG: amidase family protein [Candidatus Woesearchaeota archaeon]